uniref:Reticulon 4 receptor like 2 n=1 Tax=Catharus ustulatus TaxID=91951 RepID=A0A8C3Y5Q7_CATUS
GEDGAGGCGQGGMEQTWAGAGGRGQAWGDPGGCWEWGSSPGGEAGRVSLAPSASGLTRPRGRPPAALGVSGRAGWPPAPREGRGHEAMLLGPWLLAAAAAVAAAGAGCPVLCSCRGQAVDCSGQRLFSVPPELPLDTGNLSLAHNRIASIPPGYLGCYGQLRALDLRNNSLAALPAGLFRGARRLAHLDLSYNNFSLVPADMFREASALLRLDLSHNPGLRRVHPQAFRGLAQLRELDLSYGGLAALSLDPGTFRHLPALEELDLGDNPHLRVLAPDTFHGLHRLQALHLYRCRLASLPSGIFRGLRSLQYLYLQENGLLYLQVGEVGQNCTVDPTPRPPLSHSLQDDLFADLANLSHLFLHGNRLRALSEGVFRGLSSLDRLLLHANRLAAIHRRAFGGLARLTILYLFNNSLVALPGDPLAALPSLQFLRLNANPWACDCRARPLWAWFRRTRVSSSPVPCASPPHRRGTDLRHLRPRDFDACPEDDDDEGEEMEDGNGGGGNGVAVMGTPGRALGRPGTLPAAPPSAFYRDGLPPHDLRGSQPRPPPPVP